MSQAERSFEVSVEGLPGVTVEIIGQDGDRAGLFVEPDRLRSYRIFLTVGPGDVVPGSLPIEIVVRDLESGSIARESDKFVAPE